MGQPAQAVVPPVPSHLPSPGQVPFKTGGSAAEVVVAVVVAGGIVSVSWGSEGEEWSDGACGGSDILRVEREGDERERLEGRAMRRDLR